MGDFGDFLSDIVDKGTELYKADRSAKTASDSKRQAELLAKVQRDSNVNVATNTIERNFLSEKNSLTGMTNGMLLGIGGALLITLIIIKK